MALDFAKEQIAYGIKSMMGEYDVEEVDFIHDKEKPFFVDDYLGHEVTCISKPDDDLTMEIAYIPSVSFEIKHKEYKPTEFSRLKTIENLFIAVYNKLTATYGVNTGDYHLNTWQSAIRYYARQYELKKAEEQLNKQTEV